ILRVCSAHALLSFPTRRSSDLDLRFDPTRERFYYWADTRWIFAREGHIRSVVEDVHDKIAATEGPFYSDFAMPPGEADKKSPKRSEEHTSELQSRENLVCRLLL